MAGSIVQSKTAGAAAPGSTLTATFDSTPTSGNLLACVVCSDTTMSSGPSGWTERLAYVSNQGFYVYTKTAGSSEPTAVTVDPNGDNETSMVIVELGGVTAYEAISSTAATQGSAGQTSRTTNAVTPAGNALYLACYGLHGFGTDTPASLSYGASFTAVASKESATGPANTRAFTAVGYRSATGSQSPTLSWSNGVNNTAAVVLAFTEAGDPTASMPLTVGLAATATVARGKPTYRAAGSLAYSTNGGSSVAPGYPSGLAAGDLLVCFVGQKPATANGGTCTTPSGWVLAGSLEEAGGYGSTLAADQGNTNLFCYTKTATGSESGTLSITVGDNNVCWAQILAVEGQTGEYDTAAVTGSDTAAGSISVTFGSNPGITTGQLLIAAWCQPTDVSTPSQFSAQAITATDLTVGTAVEISEPDSSTGNDIGGFLAYAYATAGAASAAPVLTATAGGTTTNVRGPAVLLRVADLVTATATMPITAGLAATGDVTAGGSTATIPTTAGLAATGLAERNATTGIPTTATLAGTGTLGLAGSATVPTTATLTGTAIVERNGTATIPTTSGLAGTGVPGRNGTATLPTTAGLAGTAVPGRNGAATLPTTSGLTATGALGLAGAAGTIPTTATLAGTAVPERNATGTVPATAAITAAGDVTGAGGATLPVTAGLAATASVDHYATATVPTTTGLAATGLPQRNATTGIPTTATLAGTGLRETGATTAVATTATVTADATVETTGTTVDGTATLPVTAAITATATVERNATTAVATTVALAGTGLAVRDAQAAVETTATVTATGLPERHATAATTILAALTATASVDHYATAPLPVTAAVTVTGTAGSRGDMRPVTRPATTADPATRPAATATGAAAAAATTAPGPTAGPDMTPAARTAPTMTGA